MNGAEVANSLNSCVSWPHAFTVGELLDFTDLNVNQDVLRSALLSDERFIALTHDADEGDYFVPASTLFHWLVYFSSRLAQAGQSRLSERRLAAFFSSLRASGKWDTPPPWAVEFGQHFGFIGPAWTQGEYVFPIAHILSYLSPDVARVARRLLESFADSRKREIALKESLERVALREVLSTLDLDKRVVRVVTLREGLSTGTPMTLEEIGVEMGVTRERVRQIEAKFWSRIRDPLYLWPFVEALVYYVMCKGGSLLITIDSSETQHIRFVAKCLDIPLAELPDINLMIMGLPALPSFGQFPTALEADTVASFLESAVQPCLVDSDLKLLADSIVKNTLLHLTKSQRVYLALCSIGKPSYYSKVADVYNTMFPDDESTEHNIHAILGREKHGVVWTGAKGKFALEEWGYKRPSQRLHDAVADIVVKRFQETGKPVPFVVIMGEIGKYRQVVDHPSLVFATHFNHRLKRVSTDSFIPREPDDQIQEEASIDDMVDRALREFEEQAKAVKEEARSEQGEETQAPSREEPSMKDGELLALLYRFVPENGRIERQLLLFKIADQLGFPILNRDLRSRINKAISAESRAGHLQTDWNEVWK